MFGGPGSAGPHPPDKASTKISGASFRTVRIDFSDVMGIMAATFFT